MLDTEDELFRSYKRKTDEFEEAKQNFLVLERQSQDTITDQSRKIKEIEKFIQNVNKGSRSDLEQQLAEYQKKNAMLDSNLIKLPI